VSGWPGHNGLDDLRRARDLGCERVRRRARHGARHHDIGTALWLDNDHVRIFESRLEPGERGAFHIHDRTYFWTVVDAGRGLQRFADGRCVTHNYHVGETKYLVHSPEDALIHDLENVGETTLRFVTVELKH
jgi:beta-alanine degradation protein BauB